MIGVHSNWFVHFYTYVTSVRYNLCAKCARNRFRESKIENSKIHWSVHSLWSLIFLHFYVPLQRQSYIIVYCRYEANLTDSSHIALICIPLNWVHLRSNRFWFRFTNSPAIVVVIAYMVLLPCMHKLNFSQSVSVKPTSLRAERQTGLVYGAKSVFLINSHGDDMIRELCWRQHIDAILPYI